MAQAKYDRGLLGLIERVGNKLPDPVTLFIGATLLVIVVSAIGAGLGWSVQPQRPELGPDRTVRLVADGAPVMARSLLSRDGIYWLVANMVRNFINFPPLGVVLVSMLGIGIAERVGMFGAFMKWLAGLVPARYLTPMTVFLGLMSHAAGDSGYIILPPLAAGLYAAYGRSPLAGIAAAFAGIAGGFSANFIISATDTLVAPLTERGARILDPNYTVLVTCNWYFLAGSTVLLTLVGWAVTAWIVEPRINAQPGTAAPPVDVAGQTPTAQELRGLGAAGIAVVAALGLVFSMILIPGWPLSGPMPAPVPAFGPISDRALPVMGVFTPDTPGAPLPANGTVAISKGLALEGGLGEPVATQGIVRLTGPVEAPARMDKPPVLQPRWSQAIVPIILLCFLAPGLAYGLVSGAIKKLSDITGAFTYAMQTMAPIIAMAFFAAQFIGSLSYSQLDRMLAYEGGTLLVSSGLPTPALLVGVVFLTMLVNLLISSMSAKWSALAVILVPMMMMAGVSPELTQAAYRVGDSVTNIVTPLNSYIIVILAVAQRWRPESGLGSLLATMVPYSVVFAVIWTAFLLVWVYLGIPLGPGAPMWYTPGTP